MKRQRWRWLAGWLLGIVLACSCDNTPPDLPRDCLPADTLRTGWGRGAMCRVQRDCQAHCRCELGYCLATSRPPDASHSERPPREPPRDTVPPAHPGAWVKKLSASKELRLRSIVPSHDNHLLLFGHFRGTLPCQKGQTIRTRGTQESDLFLWKMTQAGETLWCKRFGGTGDEQAHALSRDKQGAAYLLFSMKGANGSFDDLTVKGRETPDVVLLKVSTAGRAVWARRLTETYDATPGFVQVDLAGDVFVGWNKIHPNPLRASCAIAKVDRDNTLLWKKEPLNRSCTLETSVAHRNSGVLLSGTFTDWWPDLLGTIENTTDMFLISVDSNGAVRWGMRAGSAADDSQGHPLVQVGPDGRIYWSGHFPRGTLHVMEGVQITGLGQTNGFLAGVSDQGKLQWLRRVTGSEQTSVRIQAMAWKGTTLWLGGHFQQSVLVSKERLLSLFSAGKNDLFVASVDREGRWQSLRGVGGPGDDRGGVVGRSLEGNLFWSVQAASPQLRLEGHPAGPLREEAELWLWKMAP